MANASDEFLAQLLEMLGAFRSPLDARQSPTFGKLGAVSRPAAPVQPRLGVRRQAPIPGFEREFRVIQGQSGGLVPHQGFTEVKQ